MWHSQKTQIFCSPRERKTSDTPCFEQGPCGRAKSPLLWCEFFVGALVGIGFALNPHNLGVANADIDGSQCATVWHIDDNKTSHKIMKTAKSMVSKSEGRFGAISSKKWARI